MSPHGALVTAVFALGWLGPITYVGAFYQDVPMMPALLQQQHRIACLFTHEVRAWKSYHLQIQRAGDDRWAELPEAGYFDMKIFGYRTRLHRMLGNAWRKPGGVAQTRAIALWVRERHDRLNPDGPKMDAIRFVRVQHPVSTLARQRHRYRQPALDATDPRFWQIFGEVRFDGKAPTHPTHRLNARPSRGAPRVLRAPGKPSPVALPRLRRPQQPHDQDLDPLNLPSLSAPPHDATDPRDRPLQPPARMDEKP